MKIERRIGGEFIEFPCDTRETLKICTFYKYIFSEMYTRTDTHMTTYAAIYTYAYNLYT